MTMRRAAALAIATLAATAAGVDLTSQAPAARFTIVTGDLHLGPGRDPRTGEWLAAEDFRWQDELTAFLRAIDEAGGGATDLVLNGDVFDLWQAQGPDCVAGREIHLGCTEAEALERLDRILDAHPVEIAALSAFARRGTNRVIVVPGDRDAALLFPSLADRVGAALDAPGRIEVASRGYWVSDDGLMYAEHGHQIGGDPYRLAAWPEPFVQHDGRRYLARSAGERLAAALYGNLEAQYPIVDNVAQEDAGLKYAVAADPAVVPPADLGPLLALFLARPAWQQFRLELDGGDVLPPEWDLGAVRASGTRFFVESLLPDDPFRPVSERALQEGRLSLDPQALPDAELIAICDYRAALRRSRRRLERSMTQARTAGPAPAECPRTAETRGSMFDYFWRSRDAHFGDHLEQVHRTLARDGRPSQPKVFVQGHTHLAAAPVVPAQSGTSPVVLNAGAWQRTVTPFQIEQALEDRGGSSADLLRQLRPEELPACYGVVWIDPYTGDAPRARLRFWRADGTWGALPRDSAGMTGACGGGAGPPA